MRIGIIFSGKIENIDYTTVDQANPGLGGTHYTQILLSLYLSMSQNIEVFLFTNRKEKLPPSIINIVADDDDIFDVASKMGLNILIFSAASAKKKDFCNKLDKTDLVSIAWSKNLLDYKTLQNLRNCRQIKRVVFTSRQHYDYYFDDEIINKSTYIYNIVPHRKAEEETPDTERKIVTFIGALIPAKGFHILAREWKKILEAVPNAHLFVIGSGSLYEAPKKLGKLKLSEENYEKRFAKFITDKKGVLLESVKFYGILGNQKTEIIKKTCVGIANLSSVFETFCIVAVEFQQYGIPVISFRRGGLLDTVVNNKSGILIKSKKELRDSIIRLLKDDKLNESLGKNAILYSQEFDPERIVPQWLDLISDVHNQEAAPNMFSYTFIWNDLKWLRLLNKFLKCKLKLSFFPSIASIERLLKLIFKSIIGKAE